MSYKRGMQCINYTEADVEETYLIRQEVVWRKVLEEEEYDGCISGDVESVVSCFESRNQIRISQGGLPRQSSSRMSRIVIAFEGVAGL
jgi:hypothetical protein